MNENAKRVFDALEEFTAGYPIEAIGVERLTWYTAPGTETEIGITYTLTVDRCNVRRASITVEANVTKLYMARAIYEFATANGLRHGVTKEAIAELLDLEDLVAVLKEKTN